MALSNSLLGLISKSRGTPGSSNTHDDRPREMNRYMGGHRRQNHPYINGYWYLLIEPPQALFDFGSNMGAGQVNNQRGTVGSSPSGAAAYETSVWLHSTAEGFTPPTMTLTKVDVPGMGGMGSSFIAGQQLTRTFSCTFREYQDTPIFNALYRWTSAIDRHYGVSPLGGNQYLPANYKGSAYVFLCKPTVSRNGGIGGLQDTIMTDTIDGVDVEQFYFFEGVFPETAPYDGFNSDINTNDVVQLNVSFSFDGWPYGREHTNHFKKGIELFQNVYQYDFSETDMNHAGPHSTVTTLNSPTFATSDIVAGY